MTPQEIFDTVAVHLMTQGKKSQGAGECLYRGPDGLKCAAGVLIPDEDYTPKMEGKPVSELAYFRQGFDAVCVDLIFTMQICHDHQEPEAWLKRLDETATSRDLSPAVLDKWRAAS
jgi:hypothetical protein